MEKNGMYWEPEIETAPAEKLEKIQEEKLKMLVKDAYEKTALYRRKFDEVGIRPEDIKSLNDLKNLPVTQYKEDFVATPVEEKLMVPMNEVAVIWNTSGTLSGSPQLVLMSKEEHKRIISLVIRFLYLTGVTPEDTLFLLVSNDVWIMGIIELGAKLIPGFGSATIPDNQIRLIEKAKVTGVFTLPSLILPLFERGKSLGIDLKNSSLRMGIFVGEPWAESVRKKMEDELGMKFYNAYGLAELPGRGGECLERNGIHIWSDYSIVEIIDPETGEVLPTGEEGEVVITNLAGQTMPLIRYRTGDVAKILDNGVCGCGRTHPRISGIRGRVDHITKVAGVKVLPSDIEEVLGGIPGFTGEYQIIASQSGEQEVLDVKVEYSEGVDDPKRLKSQLEEEIEAFLSVKTRTEMISPGGLPKTMWKAQRIIRG
ncbi:MAG: AMP-binding protein [Thermodesulfobacteriota bacterium]|nr:AMP-binding protein [Thermodesulfobacteriota bacterium]